MGSNDHPYWDAPSYLHQNRNTLDVKQDNRWYDVVGVEPLENNPYSQYSPLGQAPTLSPERQYALSQLSKLHSPVESQRQVIGDQPPRRSSIVPPQQPQQPQQLRGESGQLRGESGQLRGQRRTQRR